ncbi:MAG: 1-acyl-sn-glycerol-3-phosphate acyltransferase [Acidobacteria bacterium]|nr:1-acyl-sn-glycerol-3-phosphate acyltransferase [Acidobacteriota bacterium]
MKTSSEQPVESRRSSATTVIASSKSSSSPRKYGLLSRLRSYFYFNVLIWGYTLFFGLTSIPASLFGDKERILHKFAVAWSKLIMKTIQSPVTITGLDRLDTSRGHVYAVNHASALDIPMLYAFLPFQFRILFKSELLGYPIIGWHLRRSGQICINQQQPSRSAGNIRTALKGLKAGMPLVIFPEGGRSVDGRIQPLLPGAFFLAIKSQVDIVPIALVGMYELLPMNTYHIKPRPLEMRVGQPIPTAGLGLHDMEELTRRVQQEMERLYDPPAGT